MGASVPFLCLVNAIYKDRIAKTKTVKRFLGIDFSKVITYCQIPLFCSLLSMFRVSKVYIFQGFLLTEVSLKQTLKTATVAGLVMEQMPPNH